MLSGTPAKLCKAVLELGEALRPAATEAWAAACDSGAWAAAVTSAKTSAQLAEAAAQLHGCVGSAALLP
jgi:hypothetical protein